MSQESVTEYNVLEENFLKSVSPTYFFQYIFGSERVNIKNRVVTYTTPWQTVYSIACLVLVILSGSFFMQFYFNAYFYKSMVMYLTCDFGWSMQIASYILNMFINRFTQRENNVRIYEMLQKVDRIFQLDKHTYFNDFQQRLNVVVISLIIVGFLSGFGAHAVALLDTPAYTIFYAFGLLTIYLDIVMGAGFIYFLAIRMRAFNRMIKDHIEEYKGKKEKAKWTFKKKLLSLCIPNVKKSPFAIRHDKWLESLQHILRCYATITELFSFSILNISFTVLIWTFLVIGAMVLGFHNSLFPLSATITIGLWAVFYYIQLSVVAMINDWFIMEVKTMKLLCIRLISYNYDGPFQKPASEMIRAIHYNTPIFDVYGLFVMDRKLPLEIIGVIASNVLVLVQFII